MGIYRSSRPPPPPPPPPPPSPFPVEEQKEAYLPSSQYPETIVVAIALSGTVTDAAGKDFRVPAGMDLFKINATGPCATCSAAVNFTSTRESIEAIAAAANAGNEALRELALQLQTLLRNSKQQAEMAAELEKSGVADADPESFFNLQECSGKLMINKSFYRPATTVGDMAITALNMPGQPDILKQMLLRKGLSIGEEIRITTKTLLAFLMNCGVKRAIIIDFSCNNFCTAEH